MVAVSGEPGGPVVGLTAMPGPVTVRVWAPEVPPPGAGVKTVMLSGPELAISVAGMLAVSWEAETNVVGRGLPLTWTAEFPAKLEPEAVRVNAAPPPATAAGLMLESVGAGGGAGGGGRRRGGGGGGGGGGGRGGGGSISGTSSDNHAPHTQAGRRI